MAVAAIPSRRAFTLVELLVVIGVVAVLIAMLMPALNKARAASLAVVCGSNLRQVGVAQFMYAAEYRGWIGVNLAPNGAGFYWHHFLTGGLDAWAGHPEAPAYTIGRQYITKSSALLCPAEFPFHFQATPTPAYEQTFGFNADALDGENGPPFRDGGQKTGTTVARPQGAFWLFLSRKVGYRNEAGGYVPPSAFSPVTFARLTNAKRPTEHILFADTIRPYAYGAAIDQASYFNVLSIASTSTTSTNNRLLHFRHNNAANMLFADGHIERIARDRMLSLGKQQIRGTTANFYFVNGKFEVERWNETTRLPWP